MSTKQQLEPKEQKAACDKPKEAKKEKEKAKKMKKKKKTQEEKVTRKRPKPQGDSETETEEKNASGAMVENEKAGPSEMEVHDTEEMKQEMEMEIEEQNEMQKVDSHEDNADQGYVDVNQEPPDSIADAYFQWLRSGGDIAETQKDPDENENDSPAEQDMDKANDGTQKDEVEKETNHDTLPEACLMMKRHPERGPAYLTPTNLIPKQ